MLTIISFRYKGSKEEFIDIIYKTRVIFSPYRDHGVQVCSPRQVAEDGEDDQSGEDGGEGVTDAHDEGIPADNKTQ